MPASVPQAALDADGICSFCRAYDPAQKAREESLRERYEADLEAALTACRGAGQYDALVCLSGGKDSLYLLHRLKVDYGLNVLAFTTDINIPRIAWSNIHRTIAKLGCDHLVYRPPDAFYRKLFGHLLRNQEQRGAVYTVSYVYAPLFEGDALRVAQEKGIPLVLAGYSPGQPEPERMVYEFSRELICRTDWTPPALRAADVLSAEELARFWNPARFAPGTAFARYLAPFHAWRYDQDEIMKRVVALGLVANTRHASPINSNYPINWLLMYSDLENFGYNPYAPEFSELIRSGKASRRYWRVMAPLVDFLIRNRRGPGREVTRSMRWLGITRDELRVTLPRGAYDPVPAV
ncbi:MAG: hypothetical protein ABI552_01965 [Casimicrobiaceae bacterium]